MALFPPPALYCHPMFNVVRPHSTPVQLLLVIPDLIRCCEWTINPRSAKRGVAGASGLFTLPRLARL
jgi:hypothetical protein